MGEVGGVGDSTRVLAGAFGGVLIGVGVGVGAGVGVGVAGGVGVLTDDSTPVGVGVAISITVPYKFFLWVKAKSGKFNPKSVENDR